MTLEVDAGDQRQDNSLTLAEVSPNPPDRDLGEDPLWRIRPSPDRHLARQQHYGEAAGATSVEYIVVPIATPVLHTVQSDYFMGSESQRPGARCTVEEPRSAHG
jgi:hypothetical protein